MYRFTSFCLFHFYLKQIIENVHVYEAKKMLLMQTGLDNQNINKFFRSICYLICPYKISRSPNIFSQ